MPSDDIETDLRALQLLGMHGDNRACREFLTRSGGRLRAYFRRQLLASATTWRISYRSLCSPFTTSVTPTGRPTR